MPAPQGFLAGLAQVFGGGLQGYAMDDENRTRKARQTALDAQSSEMHAAQLRNIEDEIRARNTPKPATPKRTYDSTRGVLVDEDTGSVVPLNGLPPKPAAPPQYDSERGGFVSPDGTFKPVAGLPPRSSATRLSPWESAGFRTPGEYLAFKGQEAAATRAPKQDDGPKASEFSNKAALVYPRAQQSAAVLERFFEHGIPAKQGLGKLPIVGNFVLSDAEQQAQQAAETVSSAVLRLESGAAISEHEVKEMANQMLPKPGDSDAVRAQKRATLHVQLERMKAAAAPTMGHETTPATHTDTIDDLIRQGLSDAQIKIRLRGGTP